MRRDPLRTFSTALARNPGNTRARLGLARTSFAASSRTPWAYEGLVAQDATYAFARREYARALYLGPPLPRGFEAYDELLAGLPTEAIAVDVFGSGTPGSGPRGARLRGRASSSPRPCLEARGQGEPRLEARAGDQRSSAWSSSSPPTRRRASTWPSCHRRPHQPRDPEYDEDCWSVRRTLEATEALAGAREVSPHLDVISAAAERNGRDGLAFMDESWTLTDVAFPFGDRDDYAGIGIGRRSYSTSGRPAERERPAPLRRQPRSGTTRPSPARSRSRATTARTC